MAGRRAQRRTVLGYVQASRFQMERAVAAAVRCGEITRDELFRLRLTWREIDETVDRIARKRSKKPRG